ncbi:MAG: hypothetical protein QXG17_06285 [Sulfolobales archaeon]
MTLLQSINVLAALVATLLTTLLTFKHFRISTGFRDFTVFVVSLMCAIATTATPYLSDVPLLPWIIVLYVNGLWLYGAEPMTPSVKAVFVSPALTRVFVGLIMLAVASWLSISSCGVSIALVVVLIYVLLGAYRTKELMRT